MTCLYTQYYAFAVAMAKKYSSRFRDPHAATDIAHRVLLKCVPLFTPESNHQMRKEFIARQTWYTSRNQHRDEERHPTCTLDIDVTHRPITVDPETVINRLPDKTRPYAVAEFIEQKTRQEMAAQWGVSTVTLDLRRKAAHADIRRIVEDTCV